MYTLVIIVHMAVSLLLITVILIQQGRGGGLLDSVSSIESIFGTKTNSFLTKTTTVLAILFITTCLGLTFLSTQRSKSLMERNRYLPNRTEKQNPVQTQIPTQASPNPQETKQSEKNQTIPLPDSKQ